MFCLYRCWLIRYLQKFLLPPKQNFEIRYNIYLFSNIFLTHYYLKCSTLYDRCFKNILKVLNANWPFIVGRTEINGFVPKRHLSNTKTSGYTIILANFPEIILAKGSKIIFAFNIHKITGIPCEIEFVYSEKSCVIQIKSFVVY